MHEYLTDDSCIMGDAEAIATVATKQVTVRQNVNEAIAYPNLKVDTGQVLYSG